MEESPIQRSERVLGGTAVFRGTRVPVQALIDCLEAGDRLDDFLVDYPTVTRDQAVAVLDERGRLSVAMRVLLLVDTDRRRRWVTNRRVPGNRAAERLVQTVRTRMTGPA